MKIYLPKQITPKKRNHLKNCNKIFLYYHYVTTTKTVFRDARVSREAFQRQTLSKKKVFVANGHIPVEEIEY